MISNSKGDASVKVKGNGQHSCLRPREVLQRLVVKFVRFNK